MKHGIRLAVVSLAALLVTTPAHLRAVSGTPQGPPPPGYQPAYQGGWDGPPQEYNEIQRRGFHDGIEGARKDYENHRPPNINGRAEFRHPNVPPPFVRDYRDGFRRGYQAAVRHMMGGPH